MYVGRIKILEQEGGFVVLCEIIALYAAQDFSLIGVCLEWRNLAFHSSCAHQKKEKKQLSTVSKLLPAL